MPMPAVTFTYHLAIQHYPTYSVPQTGWWCRCACNRASSYRTGLSSTAAPAASDLTLEVGSFHPHTAAAPCRASSYTTPPQRSASRNFASRDSLKVRLRCDLILCSCHKRFTVFLLTPCVAAMSWQLQWVIRSEEHTSELQSHSDLVCRLLLEKKKANNDCKAAPLTY